MQVDEDEELLVEEGGEKRRPKSSGGIFPFGGMCACLSVDYYRPYFDVGDNQFSK